MNKEQFKAIIENPESAMLDYKSDMYNFKNDKDKKATSAFVKDVISMANTIRVQNSYIIFGIKEELGEYNMLGISNNIDDAILQDKIKDKVVPRPKFYYSNIEFEGKNFGVIEIPVEKYEFPIMPIVKDLKGLHPDDIYYRNGSSNTKATPLEIIKINDWLKSLPSHQNANMLNLQLSGYISELTKEEEKISTIISKLYPLAKSNNLTKLQKFCEFELKGFRNKEDEFSYRAQNVFFSLLKADINQNPFQRITPDMIKREMEESNDFFTQKFSLHYPLIEIEDFLIKIRNNSNNGFVILPTNTKSFNMKMVSDYKVYIYLFPDNFLNIYRNIRQKAIDLLMDI